MSLGLPGITLPGRRGQRQAFQHGGVTPSAHVMGDGNPEGWGRLGVAGGGRAKISNFLSILKHEPLNDRESAMGFAMEAIGNQWNFLENKNHLAEEFWNLQKGSTGIKGTYQPLSEVVHEAKLNIFTTCPPPEPLEVQFANAREMRLHARFAPHKAMWRFNGWPKKCARRLRCQQVLNLDDLRICFYLCDVKHVKKKVWWIVMAQSLQMNASSHRCICLKRQKTGSSTCQEFSGWAIFWTLQATWTWVSSKNIGIQPRLFNGCSNIAHQ